MKKIYILFTLALCSYTSFGQISATDEVQDGFKTKNNVEAEGITKKGILNIGLNQATLTNWAAGGERVSMAVNGAFNGSLVNKNGNKLWENTLDLFYGLNYVASNDFIPRKIDDRIDFASRYGVKPNSWTNKRFLKHTYLMGLARLQTQFSKGYNYGDANWLADANGISNFLSPLYGTFALGAEYRPNKNFSVFFSPAAARIIVADKVHTSLNPDGAFGIGFGETFAFQFGAYLSARYTTDITSNLNYTTRLDLYSNYLKDPQNVDVLWDNLFGFKISKYVGGTLGITMVYDNDVKGQRDEAGNLNSLGYTQLKQVLNLGFQYKF